MVWEEVVTIVKHFLKTVMAEALVVAPAVIVKMVDMEEVGEVVVVVIIDNKMVINFKMNNSKRKFYVI